MTDAKDPLRLRHILWLLVGLAMLAAPHAEAAAVVARSGRRLTSRPGACISVTHGSLPWAMAADSSSWGDCRGLHFNYRTFSGATQWRCRR
jgi:hypothetical protein